jgi:hypothetical protein
MLYVIKAVLNTFMVIYGSIKYNYTMVSRCTAAIYRPEAKPMADIEVQGCI